ncbi:Iron/manganese superoxide dismutases, C-terminal domain containing protein, putative [Angomonas deanei]|uniref:Iron/manganese superoxide dismutases, C-terminal domain containing protein, putative n=1 Tax=Angomonas deanei TaxID=59799 RepID=A0A7G2CIC7_9TRYP|nr:Iron/manganese superoxide dismutases, C-terminal domain containing protein, putative [Angomonas deanei]
MGVAPLLSREQFALQQVFHRDAIDTLNQLTIGTELEGHSLDVVIRKTSFDATRAAIHTAAAEHFNYCFWYKSLRPWGVSVPSVLREELQLQYSRNGMLDGVEEVQRLMLLSAQNQLSRCGWVYLVWTGRMFDVLEFSHGTCPIGSGLVPLLALNVHTSSFAHDYAPLDPNGDDGLEIYVHNFFKTCNWGLAHRYFTEANVKE